MSYASTLVASSTPLRSVIPPRVAAEKELAPRVVEAEAEEKFPREVFRTLGRAGLL
ncbi:acyl-CoA dehydrogenase family protein, partial [Streptomyces mirabilis]